VSARGRAAAGLVVVAAVVFAENLFGHQLNALFLRFPGIDKILHGIEYSLVFAIAYWLLQSVTTDPRRRIVLAAGAGLLLSVADEGIQQFAPGRSVELLDLAADCAGLALGAVLTLRPGRRVALPIAALAIGSIGLAAYDTHRKLHDLSQALQYEHNHEFGRAREHYLRAIAAGQRSAAVYNGLAWVSVESGEGNPEDAVQYARTAFNLQPGNPDVLDTYGWALHHAGRHHEALPLLREAFKQKPDMYCIHYHLGAVYESLNQSERAREHYNRQIELTGTREAAFAREALARLNAFDRAGSPSTRNQ
jgi:tetratricopeptide (TPR) repeat protein